MEVLEATADSLVLRWKEFENATPPYTLSMKESNQEEFTTLSSTIVSREIRKKNLQLNKTYTFKVTPTISSSSSVFNNIESLSSSSSSYELVYSMKDEVKRMLPPTLTTSEGDSITIGWDKLDGAEGYLMRFREFEGDWHVVNTMIKGSGVKKKQLDSKKKYFFSIKPVGLLEEYDFSLSSKSMTPSGVPLVHPSITQSMPAQLIRANNSQIKLSNALDDKVLLLYFSASWCAPCRKFTPKIKELYDGKMFEVVFVSCDHNENDMMGYFKSMPWLAISYDDPAREELAGHFKVSGIPRLVVISSKTGLVLEQNAVQSLSEYNISKWCS